MMEKTITTLNCDQVAWIKDALRRYDHVMHMHTESPSISRHGQTAVAAFLMELSEIIGMPMDIHARNNATPRELRADYDKEETCGRDIGYVPVATTSNCVSGKSSVGDVEKGR